jgi:hypothetical protein
LIAWTSVHLKAPTQVTCAHCQRSLSPELQALGFRSNPATFRPGEPHILHPFSLPSTPRFVFFFEPGRQLNHHEKPQSLAATPRLPHHRVSASARGANHNPCLPFVNPRSASFFQPAAESTHLKPLPRRAAPPINRPAHRRGANSTIALPFGKPRKRNLFRRRSDVRGHSRACRAEADAHPLPQE